jgi:flagellar hook assembly protein FlgD
MNKISTSLSTKTFFNKSLSILPKQLASFVFTMVIVLGSFVSGWGQTITISSISTNSTCINSATSVTVTFTSTGYSAGNKTFTAQLSNSSGSFVSGVTSIGTYSVNGSYAGTTTAASFTPSTASGAYLIRISEGAGGGLILSNTFSFTVNALPTATLPAAGCRGSTITISGANFTAGTGNTVTFTGSSAVSSLAATTASSLQVVIPSNATTGAITITNGNGCSVTTGSYTVNPLPTALVLTGSTICATPGGNGTITSSSSVSGINYQLFNSSNVAVQSAKPGTGSGLTWSGLSAGTGFYVIGTNATTGCVSAQSNAVNISTNSNPTATIPSASCVGTTITITGTNFTAGATNTVAFTGGSTTSTAATTATALVVVIPATATTGTITITNGNGCSVTTGSYTISTTVSPSVTIAQTAGTNPTCSGTGVTFTATPTNGGTPSYQWKKDGVDISGQTSATYTDAGTTAGSITVVMTSSLSCVTSATAT